MPCTHKFFDHPQHMLGESGLLPDWDADTLIIGTFNPCNEWAPDNAAEYFYGRPDNYFWEILPRFACIEAINKSDVLEQIAFLRKLRIALTDLLISIDDADILKENDINWIEDYKDDGINNFKKFTWNTKNIIQFIKDKKIKAIYFTRISQGAPFGRQMTIIKKFSKQNRVPVYKLFTPSGQRLGDGKPRKHKLINKWFEEGGNRFPFLCPNFDLNSFPWQ